MKKRIFGILLIFTFIISMTFASFGQITIKSDKSVNADDYKYTLMVTAKDSNKGSLSYQWYQCQAGGKNPSAIQGETSNIFKPDKVKETRYYYCVVTSTRTVEVEAGQSEENSNEAVEPNENPENEGQESQHQNQPTTEKVTETAVSDIFEVKDATPPEKTKIQTFSVEKIDEPVTGALPDTNASISDKSEDPGYAISEITWKPNHNEFEENTEYTVYVKVVINDGFEVGDGFKCLIDGNNAVASGNPTSGEFTFSYTFPATEPPDKLASLEELQGPSKNPTGLFGLPGWLWALLIIILFITIIVTIILIIRGNKKRKAEEAAEEARRIKAAAMKQKKSNIYNYSNSGDGRRSARNQQSQNIGESEYYSRQQQGVNDNNPFSYDVDKKTREYDIIKDEIRKNPMQKINTQSSMNKNTRINKEPENKNDNKPSEHYNDGNDVSYYDPNDDK